jgi:hypothetical protein
MVTIRHVHAQTMWRLATLSLLLTFCSINSVSAFDIPCKAEPFTTVVVSDTITKGASRIKARHMLLDSAVEEGIRTIAGVQVQSRSASQVSSTDGEINEKFLERMRAQSSGYGRPEVLKEEVLDSGGGSVLRLTVKVTVCVPKNPLLIKQVVSIGPTLNSRGEDLEDFRNIMESIFSSSKKFVLSKRGEGDFADIRVDGNILDYNVTERTINNKLYNRIDVNFALKAEFEKDGSISTHSAQEFTNVLARHDLNSAIDKFMVSTLTTGTQQFHDKLAASIASKNPNRKSVNKLSQTQMGSGNGLGKKPTIAVYPPIGVGTKVMEELGFDKQDITRRLEESLRASGRFVVFERSRELLATTVEAEQDLAESSAYLADAAERGKLANVRLIIQPIVTDFVLQPVFTEIDGLPGMYERTDHGRIVLTCKVLDTTSGEIKHQVTVPWEFSRELDDVFEGKTGGPGKRDWMAMAEEIGARSTSAILNTVFPIMVIKVSKGRVFLNRGKGTGLKKGDVLEVFSVGEDLMDPQTGEKLGGEDILIGKIKVNKVSAKFSTAKPLGTWEEEAKSGDIAR